MAIEERRTLYFENICNLKISKYFFFINLKVYILYPGIVVNNQKQSFLFCNNENIVEGIITSTSLRRFTKNYQNVCFTFNVQIIFQGCSAIAVMYQYLLRIGFLKKHGWGGRGGGSSLMALIGCFSSQNVKQVFYQEHSEVGGWDGCGGIAYKLPYQGLFFILNF